MHFAVKQKLTQPCKSTILQLKKNRSRGYFTVLVYAIPGSSKAWQFDQVHCRFASLKANAKQIKNANSKHL